MKIKKFKRRPNTPKITKLRKPVKNIFYKVIGRLSGKRILIVVKLNDQVIKKSIHDFEKTFNPIYQDNIIYIKRKIQFNGERYFNIDLINNECKKVLEELSYLAASEENRKFIRQLNQIS